MPKSRFTSVLISLSLSIPLLVAPLLSQEGEAPPLPTHWTHQGDIGRGAGSVTSEVLAATDPASWVHFAGNHASWRHSPIEALTPETVGDLKISWILQTGVPLQLEVSPIVYDGIMYVTSSFNRLFAVDAVTGEVLWRYDHQNPSDLRICCGPVNRGAAIAGDAVLMATLDARLISLDRKTGQILWNVEIDDYRNGFSATAAPLIVKDMAIVGIGGGEYGVRGYFDAYDLATGKRRWRHYTVPAEGEPGVETWAGDSYKYGGAPTWVTGSYDEASDTLFWASGNPGPDWNGDERLGDNLFSDTLFAIDPDTGERKWYFQFMPHDVWDYDGNTELWLVDVELDGETVPVVAQANRNGLFYLIDRRDGSFLRATQYVHQLNWGTLDPNGRPIIDPTKTPQDTATERICPGLAGGNNGAYHGAVNPDLGLAFVPTIESCMMFQKGIVMYIQGIPYMGGEPINIDAIEGRSYGHLDAIDIQTGEKRWEYRDPQPMMAGVLSTAGGVVITGNAAGHILAFNSETGEEVWRFVSNSGIRSHPIAYEIDGRVFVAVGSGGGGVVQQTTGFKPIIADGGVLLVFELPNGS